MIRKKLFWIVITLGIVGCGLQPVSPTPTRIAPTASPTATATPTRVPPPTATATSRTPQPTSAPLARLVSVGNYKLYIECTGSGGPTVVMDAGLNGNSKSWSRVAPQAAAFTRVCVYDRANTGRSERAPTPRTSQDIVNDLRALLANAGVPGPYVMVGHSLGGLNVRLYASEYRQDVVGMVLVDAAHEDEWERFRALLPPPQADEPQQLKDFRAELNDPVKGTERIDLKVSGDQIQAKRGSYGDLPLVVLSHGKPIREIPAIASPFVEALWADMQRDLLKLSINSQQIVAEQSGHDIPNDQPQLIVDAIRQVVETVRRK